MCVDWDSGVGNDNSFPPTVFMINLPTSKLYFASQGTCRYPPRKGAEEIVTDQTKEQDLFSKLNCHLTSTFVCVCVYIPNN